MAFKYQQPGFVPNIINQNISPKPVTPPTNNQGMNLSGIAGGIMNGLGNLGNWWNQSATRGQQIINQNNSSSMGKRAKSPADTVPNTSSTLPPGQVKTATPVTGSSTENGTQASGANPPVGNPTPGHPFGNFTFGGPQQTPPPSVPPTPPAPIQPQAPTGPYTPPNQGTTGVNQGGIIGNLIGFSQNESPEVASARTNLQNLQNEMARQTANIQGSPIDLSLATGQQGILGRLYATKLDAAQQALSSALTSQGQQIGATTAAGGLNAPVMAGPTNIPFNPSSGQFGPVAGNAASGGSSGISGIGAMNQQMQQGADVQTMTSSIEQTKGLINKAKQDISSSGFNATPLAIGNALQQWLNTGVIPDPGTANVINDLSEIANTIAPVLGTPGNPTNMKTVIAQELIPRLMAGQDIGVVLDNLEQNAIIKRDSARKTSQSNAVNNAGAMTTNGPTEGSIVPVGGYNYKFINGKYVLQQ